MDSEIKILKSLPAKEFTLICGLPGTAYVGKLPVDFMVQQLKAELIGEIYSKHFPPYVVINKDGLVELLRNELYCFNDENGRVFVFLSGNSQVFSPEGQYEITEKVIDWAKENGVKKVVSVAALVTEKPFDVPTVYCTATSAPMLEEAKALGVQALDEGIIGGENGLIMGIAKKKDIEGVCLLAETHGYQTAAGEFMIDPKAGNAALNILTKLLGVKIDMGPMEKQASQMDEAISRMTEIEKRLSEEMKQSSKKPSYVT